MAPAKKKQRLSDGSSATVESTQALTASKDPLDISGTEPEQSKPDSQRRSLFVRSLPPDTTSESLTALFSESYPIKHATAVIDPATKLCKGYGFVTFADAEDAQRAKDEFNGRVLDGSGAGSRKLRVELAQPRHRDGDALDGGIAAPTGRAQSAPQSTKLIVRNLPWSIKYPDQLSKLFTSYGKIKQAYIPKKAGGLLAGFGFVVMRGRKNAEKAIDGVNGKEVDGRTLAVDWAVTKDVYAGAITSGEGEANGASQNHDQDLPDGDAVGGLDGNSIENDGFSSDSDSLPALGHEDDDDSDVSSDLDSGVDDEAGEEGGENGSGEDGPKRLHDSEDRSCTLFIRNLPFSCMDEDLEDQFSQFGSIRYARVVMDPGTERSKGTGFVCFYNRDDADTCIRGAPRPADFLNMKQANTTAKAPLPSHSILQNDNSDPSGNYTMDGRVLQVSKAVDKSEANRLTEEGTTRRHHRDNDKRRLYLLSEGTISSKSKLWESLSTAEKAMREASAKQRKTLIESNPSLHLSLTRLSIRNIPRSIGSKELKALARDAVVGFASDVKGGQRARLSKEELSRGGEDMQKAELARKRAGRGIVKQAKVVFEGANGSKIGEDSGAGRSRGYGFIEYHTHRNALMGLRWLNGHAIGYTVPDEEKKANRDEARDRKKRLIVEFAIENAQVVLRRNEREVKARSMGHAEDEGAQDGPRRSSRHQKDRGTALGKRKRDTDRKSSSSRNRKAQPDITNAATKSKTPIDEKAAKRNQIIGRKRAMRRARKGGKS